MASNHEAADVNNGGKDVSGLFNDETSLVSLADNSPNIILAVQDDHIVFANRKCQEAMGYSREEFLDPGFRFKTLIDPESRALAEELFERQPGGTEVLSGECVLRTRSGKRLDVVLNTMLSRLKDRDIVVAIMTDITLRKQTERALRDSERNYHVTLDSLPDAVHMIDRSLRILLVNEALKGWHEKLGFSGGIVGQHLMKAYPFLPMRILTEYETVFNTGKVLVTSESLKFKGREVYTETRKMPVLEDGVVAKVVTVIRDVTVHQHSEKELTKVNRELVRSNRKLKRLVLIDSHTGLYTHRFLEELLETEFARAKRDHAPLSLIMLDIDYFKSVNDLYGHQFGDAVLKQFSAKLREIVRRHNSIVRYGGEEFVVIAPRAAQEDALLMAHRLLDTLDQCNFGTRKNRVKLKVSIAAVSYPEDGIARAMDMVELAEHILNKAKEFGGNRAYSSNDLRSLQKDAVVKNEILSDIKYLKEKMDRLNKRANQSLVEAVFAFAKTIEMKDHYTGEHVEKTVFFASKLAEALALPKEEVLLIKQAAMLHDLGKVGISEKILLKPGKLTTREFKVIKEHPLIGAHIIRPIHMLRDIIPYILYHHERWDGKGYPMGLKAEEIPIGARIIALADTYQALISNRPYRKAYKKEDARRIIQEDAGTHFDPKIVEVFLEAQF